MKVRLIAVLAGIASLASAPTAAADPYIGLGTSVGAGIGASAPANNHFNLLYADYQATLGADQGLNRAQPGATAASLIAGGQLATALADINAPSDTKAVTIDIGGNEYLTGQCQTNWDDPTSCPFRANLVAILTQLQQALGGDPGAEPLTIMAYYNPGFGTATESNYDRGILGANQAVACTDTGANVGLNDVIYQEAGTLGIPVADPYDEFKSGGGQALMSGDGVHPNDSGYAVIADAFGAATVPQACERPQPPGGGATDTTPPETKIDARPADKLKRRKTTYRFSSSEDGASFECRLDRGEFRACTSPRRLKRLDAGRHTFAVRAVDGAGNVDSTPAVDRFKVLRRR